MLLNSILEKLAQKLELPKSGRAGMSAPAPETMQEVRIPASEATYEAAAKAKGMKKIELEIAAAAGLLRPIGPEPTQESKQDSSKGLGELIRTIEDLKKEDRSHHLDLFE